MSTRLRRSVGNDVDLSLLKAVPTALGQSPSPHSLPLVSATLPRAEIHSESVSVGRSTKRRRTHSMIAAQRNGIAIRLKAMSSCCDRPFGRTLSGRLSLKNW